MIDRPGTCHLVGCPDKGQHPPHGVPGGIGVGSFAAYAPGTTTNDGGADYLRDGWNPAVVGQGAPGTCQDAGCPDAEDVHPPHVKPEYVYVASSWRNPLQPAVVVTLRAAGIDCYDFRNPEGGTGFSWKQVKTGSEPGVPGKGSDWESVEDYLAMVHHPIADRGFAADFDAMKRADTFVLLLPCGKSAHLELGWAVGAGKRTAILLEDPCEPELMYRMADYLAPSLFDLLGWLGVRD